MCVCVYVLVCLISCLYCNPAAAFSGTSVRKYEAKKDGPRDGTCEMRYVVLLLSEIAFWFVFLLHYYSLTSLEGVLVCLSRLD